MKVKEAKQIIESEFGNLRKEDRSQYDTLVSLLVKYGADESRPLEKLVSGKFAEVIKIFRWLLGYKNFPTRKENEGAYYWRSHLRKKLYRIGINKEMIENSKFSR